jgi:hypothetical protein
VERGVPYFAPGDSHYREWAAKAAALWDELQKRARTNSATSVT